MRIDNVDMNHSAIPVTGQVDGATASASLLGPDDPDPVAVRAAQASPRILVVCDHASNRVPTALGSMGLPAARLAEHIAWDSGALGVARGIAETLGATLVFGRYSRLTADLNRAPMDVSAVPAISDGVLIPANLGISAQQRAARMAALHDPYHAFIGEFVATSLRDGVRPVMISVHSFTPRVNRIDRPWHAGVLWDKDSRIALPLLEGLRRSGVVVGDNEPYSGRHTADYTLDRHAEGNGLAHAALELRQDLISHAGTQHIWAERLVSVLRPILEDESLYTVPAADDVEP